MCVDFNCSNREMKLTSPRLNLVIAVGGIVWYTTAAVNIPTTDLAGATALCEVSGEGGDDDCCITPRYTISLELHVIY